MKVNSSEPTQALKNILRSYLNIDKIRKVPLLRKAGPTGSPSAVCGPRARHLLLRMQRKCYNMGLIRTIRSRVEIWMKRGSHSHTWRWPMSKEWGFRHQRKRNWKIRKARVLILKTWRTLKISMKFLERTKKRYQLYSMQWNLSKPTTCVT